IITVSFGAFALASTASENVQKIDEYLLADDFASALSLNQKNRASEPNNIDHVINEARIYKRMAMKDWDNRGKHLQIALLVLNDALRMAQTMNDKIKAIDI